jgi:hypothetical protein
MLIYSHKGAIKNHRAVGKCLNATSWITNFWPLPRPSAFSLPIWSINLDNMHNTLLSVHNKSLPKGAEVYLFAFA